MTSSSGARRDVLAGRWYPCSRIAASTRRRVSADTSARPLITFDTVGTDTPAWTATSAIVADPGRRLEEGCVPEITTCKRIPKVSVANSPNP